MAFSQNSPIYLQIGDRICESIITGKWKEGGKIPSVREMSIESEVNPNTIARTYSHLQELEIIHNRRGIGYFVAEGARSTARKHMRELFIREELPPLFRLLDLLDLDMKDLEQLRASRRAPEPGENGNDIEEINL